MIKSIRELAKWEYNLLIEEAPDWNPPEFETWYKEVFLIDEAWKEIRENHN